MRSYLDLGKRIIDDGEWVVNARTGKRCLTLINADLEYDMRDHRLPILTSKNVNWEAAIAEFLGYLKGYSNAADFRALGCKTWDANANENQSWLDNPARKGIDDMGRIYGVQGRSWLGLGDNHEQVGTTVHTLKAYDQLQAIYDDLRQGIDNRAEIMTFWNPGELHLGCLKSCVHTHHFSLLNGMLYLHSYQRSDDFCLGHPFNQVQIGMFLLLMAKITNNLPGIAYHKIVNVHIYEDQLEIFKAKQLGRVTYARPRLSISDRIKTLDDVTELATLDDFSLSSYLHHSAIKYPFSV